MNELQVLRQSIPLQYTKVRESMIEYKRCQNLYMKTKKESQMKELFRMIEAEINLSCKFNSRTGRGRVE